jgi:type IV secretion system protein VirB10
VSRKGLLAVFLLILSLVLVAAFAIQRFAASGKKADDGVEAGEGQAHGRHVRTTRLEMPPAPTASAAVATAPRIPALTPTADELAEPIGVRRTGSGATQRREWPEGGPPEDAPVLLVTTRPALSSAALPAQIRSADRSMSPGAEQQEPDPNDPIANTARNLQGYQRQLQGLLDTLTKQHGAGDRPDHRAGMPTGALLGGSPIGGTPLGGTQALSPGSGLLGGQFQGSATPRMAASMLGNRSLTLPKGTAFTCALKTRVISAVSGLVGCQVQRNVFSDDGRVLLIERGSHLDGEYRIASVRPGTVRIPVLWTRIRTPLGVTVDIESPGTGQLGESGIDGYVDNRWGERIGAAMLLSLIDDSVKLVIQNQASRSDNESNADTIVLPSTTANTSKLAEKVLESTINIPPLIYQNQGGIVGIYVARDVDFSSVYELHPVQR